MSSKLKSKRIYGRRPVEEFFKSKPNPATIRHIYVSASIPKKYMAILQPYLKGIKSIIQEKQRPELDRLCNNANHQGIIVEVSNIDNSHPVSISTDSKLPRPDPKGGLREALDNFPGLYVLTDRLQDAQNLGSIIRSAEALGAMALIITGKGVRPSEVSDRISAGGSHHLPVFSMANPDGFLRDAVDRDYWLLSAAGRPDSTENINSESNFNEAEFDYDREEPIDITTDYAKSTEKVVATFQSANKNQNQKSSQQLWTTDLDLLPDTNRFILMIGHEGEGLKPSLIKRSDFQISIRMFGQLSSLNAAVASAILIERILSVRPPT
ncbi:MAG: RNA methyltransferase [Leptonema sp. (in: Bacteria)]|nr:RNA methyltransferase [Leptonema sp. (in: bacteria)]